MASSAELGMSPAQRWGKHFDEPATDKKAATTAVAQSRSVSHEEQQAARDAAWDERRRVVAHADFCARAHRPTRPDIADALLAFGREIEDEVHL